ncbi:ESX secretion-associated protein EspG [Nocardia tengchongensis]|uniref:ESX secretion-associated protein EspG n=1 Tax=Nocardia tengchongensis TaxID=2055889 RepID=UPI0036C24479
MTWQFTDLEFKVLCNRYREGSTPAPFVYTCRTPDPDEYRRQLWAAGDELDQRLDSDFRAVFEAVADPEIVVLVFGWNDAKLDSPDEYLRVHGVRRGRRACVLIQQAGESLEHSTGVTMIECEPEELARVLVAQLSEVPAGRSSAIPIVDEPTVVDLYEAPRASAFDSFEESVETPGLRFLSTPTDQAGWIRILQARSKYGPRGVATSRLEWRDLPGDGRYVIDHDQEMRFAIGVDGRKLAGHIDAGIARIVEHMESRGEQDEFV